MKTLATISIILLTFTSSIFAHNSIENFGEDEIILTESESIKCTVTDATFVSIFQNVSFNEETEMINFSTIKEILFVQLLDADDELVYQIPIAGNKLNISTDELESGIYKVNLLLAGNEKMISTKVQKT